jgi:GYF domain 2
MHDLGKRLAIDESPCWDVADRHGRIIATRLCLRQLRARISHGLMGSATWVAHQRNGVWVRLTEVLANQQVEWYLMREGSALVGPVDTATVRRGIEAGRVPLDTFVCAVGEPTWRPIDEQAEFVDLFEEVMQTVARHDVRDWRYARAS